MHLTFDILIGWLAPKIFANSTIQLGDIVSVKYTKDNIQKIANDRYVVYYIEYSKGTEGPDMTVYLSEVK